MKDKMIKDDFFGKLSLYEILSITGICYPIMLDRHLSWYYIEHQGRLKRIVSSPNDKYFFLEWMYSESIIITNSVLFADCDFMWPLDSNSGKPHYIDFVKITPVK